MDRQVCRGVGFQNNSSSDGLFQNSRISRDHYCSQVCQCRPRSGAKELLLIVARLYTISSLLEHVLHESAAELHILAGQTPFIIIREEQVAVGSACITNDNIADLLYNLATVEQMKELNACGYAQFIYLFRN